MKIKRADLENCGREKDMVVVIDVLRAFTTAAVAFSRGVKEIILVSTAQEMFDLRDHFPGALAMGEVHGIPIEGVDYGNSPSALVSVDLHDRRIIQRTTTGTQGIVRSANVNELCAASLCCASATAHWIKRFSPRSLTFVEAGVFPGGWGEEDTICADLIEALLLEKPIDHAGIKERIINSQNGKFFRGQDKVNFPPEDLEIALDIDRYDFAMRVHREDGLNILRPLY